jgi:solute carrier family 25 phosphate transporter 23/24/25/41
VELCITKQNKDSPEEIRVYLKSLRLPCSDFHVNHVMNAVDADKDGFITFTELRQFAEQNTRDLYKLFHEIDANGDGKLSMEEVRDALPRLHIHPYSREQLARMMKQIDTDGDGTIDFDEWRTLLGLIPASNVQILFQYWEQAAVIDDSSEGLMLATSIPVEISLTAPYVDSIKVIIAGGISGAASRTCTAPLERLKILYQVSKDKPPSVITGLKYMYQRDGIRGLFRGNFTNVLKVIPEKSIKFWTFETAKTALSAHSRDQELGPTKLFLAGATSGVVTHTAVFPMEVIRTRLSAAPKEAYSGIIDCAQKIAKTEGLFLPFFRGLSASLASTIPYSGLNLMTYELMKKALYGITDAEPSIGSLMFVGSASNTACQMFFYPLTVAKSRIIMQGYHRLQIKGLFPVLRDMLNEGLRGLFKGFMPQLLKSAPSHAIMFGVYEQCKRWFNINSNYKHKQ